jgi:hypothetical protein
MEIVRLDWECERELKISCVRGCSLPGVKAAGSPKFIRRDKGRQTVSLVLAGKDPGKIALGRNHLAVALLRQASPGEPMIVIVHKQRLGRALFH